MESVTVSHNSPYKTDEKGRFVKGTPPGPGRPAGKTIKELVREWLEEHPEDMEGFVKHFAKKNRELAWQMLEGSPRSNTDITSGGKELEVLTIITPNEPDKT